MKRRSLFDEVLMRTFTVLSLTTLALFSASVSQTAHSQTSHKGIGKQPQQQQLRLGSSIPQEVANQLLREWPLFSQELPHDLVALAKDFRFEWRTSSGSQPFGLGDPTARAPRWNSDRTVFYLYPMMTQANTSRLLPQESTPFGPRGTLKRPAELHQRIWMKRAVIHALVSRADHSQRYSNQTTWRQINFWAPQPLRNSPGVKSEIGSPWAFSRPTGTHSPHLDFVTFAEEHFVTLEDHGVAIDINDRLHCQEFSKSRFLEKIWPREPRQKTCPLFEHWADLPNTSHVELALAESSAVAPESLFGHLLLRPVREGWRGWNVSQASNGPSYQPMLNVGALLHPYEMEQEEKAWGSQTWKGLTGQLGTVFNWGTMAHTLLVQSLLENRKVRFFRLNLNQREKQRLFERLWELERRSFLPYHFLSQNCAYYLAWLLEASLDEERNYRAPQGWVVTPTQVLESLRSLKDPFSAKPLLEVGGAALPTLAEQSFAAHKRVHRKLSTLPGPQTSTQPLVAVLQQSFKPSPQGRSAAYQRLYQELFQFTKAERSLAQSILPDLILMEQAATIRAKLQQESLRLKLLQQDSATEFPWELEEYLGALQQNGLPEKERHSLLARLKLDLTALEWFHVQERRQLSPQEQKVLLHAEETVDAFYDLARLQAAFTHLEHPPTPQLIRTEASSKKPSAFANQHPNMRSGLHTLRSGVVSFSEPQKQGIYLSYALLSERLGEKKALRLSQRLQARLLDLKFTHKGNQNSLLESTLFEWLSVPVPQHQGRLLQQTLSRVGFYTALSTQHSNFVTNSPGTHKLRFNAGASVNLHEGFLGRGFFIALPHIALQAHNTTANASAQTPHFSAGPGLEGMWFVRGQKRNKFWPDLRFRMGAVWPLVESHRQWQLPLTQASLELQWATTLWGTPLDVGPRLQVESENQSSEDTSPGWRGRLELGVEI